MNQQAQQLPLQRTARHLAHQLTTLQLRCNSPHIHDLPVLVDRLLAPIAQQIDELEVLSAGTALNEPLEKANRYTTTLQTLLANCPNTLTPTELAPMLSPTIRLLTEAEHKTMEVGA
ncbi:hypothetical protein [Aeromonas hydrophila]|uniref:hypothetical protein n=1 Tax=Aeromonas hydrophila TaxID=644 RepID=UPI002B4929C7|nr:hypothetical protein [Aeromonas hydrophila]